MDSDAARPRNVNPIEGGPAGGLLEGRVAAYYLLVMLCETEPRGMPGALAHRIKFQRSDEGHAFDDIIVAGAGSDGGPLVLEVQAKRTLDLTESDKVYGKLIAQIATARDDEQVVLAAALGRSSTRIERDYQELLGRARKLSSGESLRRALDAPRVMNQAMRDLADATAAQLRAAGASADDNMLWRVLRRLQILVFDYEAPGSLSQSLALTLAALALPPAERHRARDLWDALVVKALSYDAAGGELTRDELADWLRTTRGIVLAGRASSTRARRRMADHSAAAIAAIDDRVGSVHLDRPERLAAIQGLLRESRLLQVVGESGTGKSALLKAMAKASSPETMPLFLTPTRIEGGGWLALSDRLGYADSAESYLSELAASGADLVFIDGLDRVTDATAQETVRDLLLAAARVPAIRVVATTGLDFLSPEQRAWLPPGIEFAMQAATYRIDALEDDEAATLAESDPRLAMLLDSIQARPLPTLPMTSSRRWSRFPMRASTKRWRILCPRPTGSSGMSKRCQPRTPSHCAKRPSNGSRRLRLGAGARMRWWTRSRVRSPVRCRHFSSTPRWRSLAAAASFLPMARRCALRLPIWRALCGVRPGTASLLA